MGTHSVSLSPASLLVGDKLTITLTGLDPTQENWDFGILRQSDNVWVKADPEDAPLVEEQRVSKTTWEMPHKYLGEHDTAIFTLRVRVSDGSSWVDMAEASFRLSRGVPAIDYSIDDDVAELPVSGWLPKDTKRTNLYRLMLAYGVNIVKGADGNPHFTFLRQPDSPPEIADDDLFLRGDVTYDRPYSSVTVLEHTYTALTDADPVTLFDNTREESGVTAKEVWFTQAPVIVTTIQATAGLTVLLATENSAVLTGQGVLTGIPYTHTTRAVTRANAAGEREKTVTLKDDTMVGLLNSENVLNRLFAYYCPADYIQKIKGDLVYRGQRTGQVYRFRNVFGETERAFLTSAELNASSFVRAACEFFAGYEPPGQEGIYQHEENPTKPDFRLTVRPRKGHQGDVFTVTITGHGQEAMTLTVRSVSSGQTLASYSIPEPSTDYAVTQAIQSAAGWLASNEKIGAFLVTAVTQTTQKTATGNIYLYADNIDIPPDDDDDTGGDDGTGTEDPGNTYDPLNPVDPEHPFDPGYLYVRVVPNRGMPGDALTAYAGGHNGTAVSAVIKNASLTTVATFAAVTPTDSDTEAAFAITLSSTWFSASTNLEEDLFIVASSGDGQKATARIKLINDQGDWTVPEELDGKSFKVVLIGGGTGGSSGLPGKPGKDTTCHTNVAEDADISGMWYGGEGGDGGAGGEGGAPGRVKVITIENAAAGAVYHWTRGHGGAGGAATGPITGDTEVAPNPGSAGTASSFGIEGGTTYSTADSDAYTPAAGVYDPINGNWYALKGNQGIAGGKGGARKVEQDGYFVWVTDGEDVTGDKGTVWHGGRTGTPMTAVDGLPEAKLTAYGGNGAGAAVGLDRAAHPEMDGGSDQEATWEVVEDGV